jgi:hypothetical protein
MAIVVKWRKSGEYLSGLYFSRKGPRLAWDKRQSEAMLFQDIDGAKVCVKGHMGQWGFAPWQVYFVRLVPRKRNASPQL